MNGGKQNRLVLGASVDPEGEQQREKGWGDEAGEESVPCKPHTSLFVTKSVFFSI